MNDLVQTMPTVSQLCDEEFTPKQWLRYYKNTWMRNLTARCIDVQTDVTLKAINPEELVVTDEQKQVPVKERLEYRKMLVQDALNLIAGIDVLLAIPDEEFTAKVLSKEALAVAEDMIPKPAEPVAAAQPAPVAEATVQAEAPAEQKPEAHEPTPGAVDGQDAN